jgi:hypothetical protein
MKEMAHAPLDPMEIPTTAEAQPTSPDSGVRTLMLAVLEEALQSLRASDSLVRTEAEQWMMSGEQRYVFSFAVICETLNLEPSAVRRSIIGLLEKKQTRGRLVERTRPYVWQSGAIGLRVPRTPRRGRRRIDTPEGTGRQLIAVSAAMKLVESSH